MDKGDKVEFILRGGISIPRQYENELWYREIRADLLRRSQKYNTPDFDILKFYLESKKFLTIPRLYPIEKYIGNLLKPEFIDKRHKGEDIQIEHSIKPRNKIQIDAIQYMLENDNGLIQLQPGVGKTVISIYVIATRKKKTLILVHRDSLADQWMDRILQFTNLTQDKIIRLTSSNFIQALTHPIIIVTNQTLLSILKRQRLLFLTELNKANIGIFIADEAHTSIAASTFSECSIHIPSKVTFGLSATPYRWDGNGDIIDYHLGKKFESDISSGTMTPNITFILFDYEIDQPRRFKYLYWEGKFQQSRYLNLIKKSKPFLEIIKNLLTKFKVNRQIIFMCERIKLIDLIFDWFDHNEKTKFIAGIKNDVLKTQVVFTTPGKCRDGVDIPEKDCLILTSPISNIAQVCGRIIREYPNKKTPIIIDLVDIGCKPIKNTIWGRIKYYKKNNWIIKYLTFRNNKIIEIDKDKAMEILNSKKNGEKI